MQQKNEQDTLKHRKLERLCSQKLTEDLKLKFFQSKDDNEKEQLRTTFKQESPGVLRHGRYEYSRGGNPTRECLEECVAKLENGNHCMACSSGLGATMSIIEAFLEVKNSI